MKNNKKINKIVFLEKESDVDVYISNNVKNSKVLSSTLFIAMSPKVYSYLKQKGFLVQNTIPYFTNDSHRKVLESCKILTDWIRKRSDFVDIGIGVKHAYKDSFIYWMRLNVFYCLWAIEIVSNAVKIHQPVILSAHLSGRKFVPSLVVESEEKYLGYIVKIIAHEKNLRYENFRKSTIDNLNLSISWAKNYMDSITKFILKYGKFLLWKKIILTRSAFTGNRPIYFTTKFYQMDKLAKEIQEQLSDRQFYFLEGPTIPSFKVPNFIIRLFCGKYSKIVIAQQKLFENLEKEIKKQEELFSYRGIPFADIMIQKLKNNIADYIIGLILWSIKFDQFINTSKASAFVSNGNRSDDVLLAELCHKKNIPAVLISHGSHIYPKNKYESIEWGEHGRALLSAPFSFLALQSPLAEGYLESFPSAGKKIKTGPLIWGRPIKREESKLLFKKMLNGKYDFGKIKVVLHAGSPKSGKCLRPYVNETPDEYIQALCELANSVEKIPDTILIIKFRPQSEVSINTLKHLVPFSEKVILSVNEPFIDVLGMADLLVSFSSTTIEEALQNRIPILLFGGGGRYQHVPAYEIKPDNSIQLRAVYHVREARNLENAIRGILNLNIDSKKERHLFEPYIYAQGVRTSFADLLKLWSEGCAV